MRFHIKEKKHQDEIKQLVQSKDIDVMFRGKRHDVHFDMVRPSSHAPPSVPPCCILPSVHW